MVGSLDFTHKTNREMYTTKFCSSFLLFPKFRVKCKKGHYNFGVYQNTHCVLESIKNWSLGYLNNSSICCLARFFHVPKNHIRHIKRCYVYIFVTSAYFSKTQKRVSSREIPFLRMWWNFFPTGRCETMGR